MKKLFLILFAGVMLLSLNCGGETEFDIVISLTNPQDTPVEFDGHYTINDGAEQAMTGTTPEEYAFTLGEGDEVDGIIYKSDSTNVTDTLHFEVSVNDEEQTNLTRDIIIPTELGAIQFSFSVQ